MKMNMKILKIQAKGLKLFEKEIEINFYAKQRVDPNKNEMLTNIFSNVYINNVIAMVGINASGKTSSLKVISFVLQLLKNEPINAIKCNGILAGLEENDEVTFNIFFIDESEKLSKLNTVIKMRESEFELKNEIKAKYYISNETLWTKSITSIRSKKELFDFSKSTPVEERKETELFLLDDVSVMVAYNKKNGNSLEVFDSIDWTDINALRFLGDFPLSLVQFLDPSIEYLECEYDEGKKVEIRLKFYNEEEVVIYQISELSNYLSSGTIKGINVFIPAIHILQKGGYIIIDELENHFNKEIVSTLIRLFMDSEINTKGAVLIFSTHYVELLDIFDRNDSIYIIRKNKGINIENLSDRLNRNDGKKKSELFQSGYLENTTPSYESYIKFKRTLTEKQKFSEV